MPKQTQLSPGEHTIDTVTPTKLSNGHWAIKWSIRVDEDSNVTRKTTQAKTKGEARRKAKSTAKELLESKATDWRPSDNLGHYAAEVSAGAISKADLRPTTRERYRDLLKLLLGDCEHHDHRHSLREHTIRAGAKPRQYENCLREIAELHGYASAKQARTVLGKYVSGQLRRDELLVGDPLARVADRDILGAEPAQERGGQALSSRDYDAAVEHLLGLDPAEGVEPPKRGRWSLENRIAKRRNTIHITLLQAVTGLRISEARSINFRDHVLVEDDSSMRIHITSDISKTRRPRTVPVLDGRVASLVLERMNQASKPEQYVIGAPSDPMSKWETRNCRNSVADLYNELAEILKIDLLKTERSHVWRATLNSMLAGSVPEVVRAAFFGHDAKMNRRSYTDLTDVAGMVEAASARRLEAV